MPAGVVKMLLAKGADQEAKGDGETARMLAAKRGDSEVARLLGVPAEERKLLGGAPAPAGRSGERSVAEAVEPAPALVAQQSHNFIRIGRVELRHPPGRPPAAAAPPPPH